MPSPRLRVSLALFALLFCSTAWTVEVNQVAPEVELPQVGQEKSLRLTSLRGKIVYVDFWASWCPPCRKSLPLFNVLRNQYADHFEVFAINVDEELDEAMDFLKKYPVDYPVLLDPQYKSAKAYGLKGMPTGYLLDQNGKITAIHQSFKVKDMQKLEAQVKSLVDKMQSATPASSATSASSAPKG